MGRFLNPGNEMFQRALNSQIYVDKSGLIAHLNQILGSEQCSVCVSRPRRFGKSMSANMLVAYYDRSCDSRAQFEGLEVVGDPSFERHLNKYDVISLNMQDFIASGAPQGGGIQAALARLNRAITSEVARAYPDTFYFDDTSAADVLAGAYASTRVPFVFVIDEWDVVFRAHKDDRAAQALYLDWLRALLKDKPYVALAYMTGILPIKKYGRHSALNMFSEVSMVDATPVSEYTGFTEAEVAALAARYGADLEGLRAWYDGYDVDGVDIYNPRSVVESLLRGNLGNYWTQTETFEALRVYIEMDMDGLRGKVVQLVAGGQVEVDTATFQNDMSTFATADDVLTLLVHLGYLTYDSAARTVRIPNREVADQYASTLRASGWHEVARSIRESESLLAALIAGDADVVAAGVAAAHEDASSVLRYNDENSLACALSLALYTARRTYTVHREMPAGKGFADLVLAPRPGNAGPGIVVELKRGGTPQAALEQIRERGYERALRGRSGKALLAGIAYDPATKEHSCLIEQAVEAEEL